MGTVAVIGEEAMARGFALAGVLVLAADGPAAVRHAWQTLPPQVEVVILTPTAAGTLALRDRGSDLPLIVVLDEEAVP